MTDVEGSTRLWEQDPAAVATALRRHDELAAEIVGAWRGRLVKPRGEGDSLFVVFAQPVDAVGCAVALQLALRGVSWPQGAALRVRMAVHTGRVRERDGDFYGPTINRCA